MATEREQLYEALRRADAAGDEAAARRLAEYIQSLGPETVAPARRQGEVEKFVRAGASAVADKAVAGAKWARDAFVGPSDLPDLPEFDAPAPTGMGTAKTALGLLTSNDPAAHVDILRKHYPGIQFRNAHSDENGQDYTIAFWTDENGQEHKGYINAPGFSRRDAIGLGGQAAAYLPAARFGQGASMLTGAAKRAVPGLAARIGRTAAATAATRAGLDGAAGPLGSDQGINWPEVAVTGAAGGAAEVAAPVISGIYRGIRGNPLRSGPGLSRQGQRLAGEAGIDAAGMPPEALQEFARAAEPGNIAAAGRSAEVTEFGIPATRGQLTQGYQQLNLEDRMRRGLLGSEPEAILKGLDQRQADAIGAGADKVQSRLQPRRSVDVPEAQSRFMSGVQKAERAADKKVDDAYSAMRGMGHAGVPTPDTKTLMGRFMSALDEKDRFVDPVLTPATGRAMRELEERLGQGGGVTLADFEKARRVVMSAQRAAGSAEDKSNVGILKSALDKWLDETVDAGLMSGDPGVVKALKDARLARTEYGRLFGAKDKNDAAGKIVEKIIEKAETPEMAINYVFGQGSLAGRAEATGAVKRLKNVLGGDSDAWNALREAAWNRLTRDGQGRVRSPTMLEKEWNEFSLRNRSLRDTLFNEDEVALMNRYRKAVSLTNRPPTNPSQTAFAIESALRQMLRGFGARQRLQGDFATGSMLNFVSRLPMNPLGIGDWARRRAAAQAVGPLPGGPRRPNLPVAAGTPLIEQGVQR